MRIFAVAGSILTALAIAACSDSHLPTGGFWFEDVTFQLSERDTAFIDGPLTDSERAVIKLTATAELRTAFSGIALAFVEKRTGIYRVAVLQELQRVPPHMRITAAAGESHTLGPFGGRGAISFAVLAQNAIHYTPPNASRRQIVDAIGRGIGRAAAHEFAHQILPNVDLHAVADKESYEYGNADRPAQYYGALHWVKVKTRMAEKLGGTWWTAP